MLLFNRASKGRRKRRDREMNLLAKGQIMRLKVKIISKA